MEAIVETNLILSFDELRILLYSQGYRECEGVYMPEKKFSSQDIVTALQKLVENGLLTVGVSDAASEELPLIFDDENAENSGEAEELFFIRKDLLKMIRIIGAPDSTEIVEADGGHRIFCYYSEDGTVSSERYEKRRERVRLTLTPPKKEKKEPDELEAIL